MFKDFEATIDMKKMLSETEERARKPEIVIEDQEVEVKIT